MEMNLNLPYEAKTSLPAVAELAFYCENNRELLFEEGPIEIRCRAGVHSVGMRWPKFASYERKSFICVQNWQKS